MYFFKLCGKCYERKFFLQEIGNNAGDTSCIYRIKNIRSNKGVVQKKFLICHVQSHN